MGVVCEARDAHFDRCDDRRSREPGVFLIRRQLGADAGHAWRISSLQFTCDPPKGSSAVDMSVEKRFTNGSEPWFPS